MQVRHDIRHGASETAGRFWRVREHLYAWVRRWYDERGLEDGCAVGEQPREIWHHGEDAPGDCCAESE